MINRKKAVNAYKMTRKGKNPFPLPSEGIVAPSLLSVDFARAGEQITQVLEAGAQILHVDVMDGHFVPNLSMGPPVVDKLRKFIDVPLDIHLMVTDPGFFIEPFANAGADTLNFHIEACGRYETNQLDEARGLIKQIRDLGLGVGITLKPQTPVSRIDEIIELIDFVLVMTVEPGFGGQDFMSDMLPKIKALRGKLSDNQRLEVDGGIDPKTAKICRDAGADIFVAGNSIFATPDPGGVTKEMLEVVR